MLFLEVCWNNCTLTTAHLGSLSQRLQHLASVIENPDVPPNERLMILKEVAEEARAYKMGGEDKIRVAVNMSDMVCYFESIITCLLYTSPSPRDATLSRMPSSA